MNINIDTAGVIDFMRDDAKKEIAEYLGIFLRDFSKEVRIDNVIVAGDFEKTVNKIWSDRKNHLKYEARQHAIKAVGKTLHIIKKNSISFNVIIDGQYIGAWEDDEKVTRFELFLHEFIHAFLSHNRFHTMGAAGFKNDYLTIEGVCFSMALTRDDYIVDSYLDVLCKKFLTDDKNRPLGLNKLNLDRGIDYYDTLLKMLDEMPGIVSDNTAAFKSHEKNMNDVWHILSSYVEELLTVFAHLAGSREKEADWNAVSKTLSETGGYRNFLTGHLKKIYNEWINYFLDGYNEAKSLEIIGQEIQGIFHNCGFNFRNVDGGIYITVN